MKEKYENELREIRKLIDILNTWGNVAVNGGVSAATRLKQLCIEIQSNGYSSEDINKAIQDLD